MRLGSHQADGSQDNYKTQAPTGGGEGIAANYGIFILIMGMPHAVFHL